MSTRLGPDQAEQLHEALVQTLIADGAITTAAMASAMHTAPRHLFTPGIGLDDAYRNDVVRYQHDSATGRCVSSVSAPWLQAMLAEAAG